MLGRLLLLVVLPLLGGGLGYGAGRVLAARQAAAAHQAKADPVVQLGQFVFQIYHPAKIREVVAEVQLQLAPGAEGAALDDPLGQAELRDAVYAVLFDAALTPQFQGNEVPAAMLADVLAAGLGRRFPKAVAAVQILTAVSSEQPRS